MPGFNFSQNVISPAPVIETAHKETHMYAAYLDSNEQISRSLDFTADEIKQMYSMNILNHLLEDRKIGLTQGANASRKESVPAVRPNRIQNDQLARALAYVHAGIYRTTVQRISDSFSVYTLEDTKGSNDRVVFAKEDADGAVQYYPYYGFRKYNNFGKFLGIDRSTPHPVLRVLSERVEDYNEWVDRNNEAVKAYVVGAATEEQIKALGDRRPGEDMNRFVIENTFRHISAANVYDKYTLIAWLTLEQTVPAFRIIVRKDYVEQQITRLCEGMDRPFQSELRKLAGIQTEA